MASYCLELRSKTNGIVNNPLLFDHFDEANQEALDWAEERWGIRPELVEDGVYTFRDETISVEYFAVIFQYIASSNIA